ncbi:MAG: hypothetical protein GY721_12820 [Deltaproteobacteria bacterium]|jgi:hypothetical protein|nr:hypothetical protein [Deltaproteobacteria bacterium]
MEVAKWLTKCYPDPRSAHSLIEKGHRSSIEEAHRFVLPEYKEFETLTGSRNWIESDTIAYHDGTGWKFWHDGQLLKLEKPAKPTRRGSRGVKKKVYEGVIPWG